MAQTLGDHRDGTDCPPKSFVHRKNATKISRERLPPIPESSIGSNEGGNRSEAFPRSPFMTEMKRAVRKPTRFTRGLEPHGYFSVRES